MLDVQRIFMKIVLTGLVYFFIVHTISAQKVKDVYYKKDVNKNLSKKNQQLIPINVFERREDIINYFLQESKGIEYNQFKFPGEDPDEVESIVKIDDLLTEPQFIKIIDKYIEWDLSHQKKEKENQYNSTKLKQINLLIISESKKGIFNQDKSIVTGISNSINSLANSKEKISLLLQYAQLIIDIPDYWKSVDSFYYSALKKADSIKNKIEQAHAYVSIGDFLNDCGNDFKAIDMYLLALEHFDTYGWVKNSNYNYGAQVCEKMAQTFSKLNNVISQKSVSTFYVEARNLYAWANDTISINSCDFKKIAQDIYIWANFPDERFKYHMDEILDKNLRILKSWHLNLKTGKFSVGPIANYFGFKAIGDLLRANNKYQEAIIFYMQAFFIAVNLHYSWLVTRTLNDISYAYAYLGKKNIALQYQNLALHQTKQMNDLIGYMYQSLNCLYEYNLFQQTDTALHYMNKIQSDTFFYRHIYPPHFDHFISELFKVKYQIFDSAKMYDSARIYEREYDNFQKRYLMEHSGLSFSMMSSTFGLFKQSVARDIKKREREKKGLEDQIIKLDSISEQLQRDTTTLNKLNRASLDSLKSNRETIRALALDANYYGSLAQENNKLADKAKFEAQEAQSKKDNAYLTLGILVVAFIALTFFMSKKIRKQIFKTRKLETESVYLTKIIEQQKIEAERLAIENSENNYKVILEKTAAEMNLEKSNRLSEVRKNEYNRINELAKSKIHNFRSDITEIDNLVQDDNPLSKIYLEAYKAFLTVFFRNWKKEKVTLYEELEEFESYLKVKQVTNQINFKKRILIPSTDSIHFLQSVFDTLLDNSVLWGFKDSNLTNEFSIEISQQDEFVICIITDNGKPPISDELYFCREDSGLNLLRKRVINMYEILNKEMPNNCFVAKRLSDNRGTVINIIMPYEKV